MLHGGFTREGVKSYLNRLIADKTVLKGASGVYRIGADRDARRDLYIVESHDGQYRLVKKLPPT